ncbi:precorrin-2 dehydrogenase/sirohydrochlorin ferrochelatase family protein [Lewinella cohaerens]|uniref:precorrin-2 dehydrogenase/sirohydrochlorin ferrochelatase family protein n=1 Tax=Lewinella cohaerens TaxID=70995 RepID=UPI000375BC63|nr:bifunctional precorrin-2 dehydrogenase/sirohydrochlorin ferrochelatase [Lewinella cohaerens]
MNTLYPIFLKTEQLDFLIIGGGNVAYEKLFFILKSSPQTKATVVAPFIREEVRALADDYAVELVENTYNPEYLEGRHIVIATTDNPVVNRQVYEDARAKQLLVNVADTPELCDLYLGGIVTKGNLKIAISTNGKSPTVAKRLRQLFENIFPEDMDKLLQNLHRYRSTLKLSFEQKVDRMNALTQELIKSDD